MDRKEAVAVLREKGEVVITCNGSSMRPRMQKGDNLLIKLIDFRKLRVNDAVFVRIKGALQVHKIAEISKSGDEFCISNAAGWINGWVKPDKIYGLCVKVNKTILVSDEDIIKR